MVYGTGRAGVTEAEARAFERRDRPGQEILYPQSETSQGTSWERSMGTGWRALTTIDKSNVVTTDGGSDAGLLAGGGGSLGGPYAPGAETWRYGGTCRFARRMRPADGNRPGSVPAGVDPAMLPPSGCPAAARGQLPLAGG